MKKVKNIHAVELGKRGGEARAKSLSKERRMEISINANKAKKEKSGFCEEDSSGSISHK